MIDENLLRKAVHYYTEDPSCKKELDDAPSGLSRKYLELRLYLSFNFDQLIEDETVPDEKLEVLIHELMDDMEKDWEEVESRMNIEDWEYIYRHTPINPERGKCMKRIKELKAKQQEPGTE
ncbi:MAG: hypothetical protein LUE27_06485 [Clostridia bacterium]|nr:hypothetical protein [Clostridia bacterium]